jgi:hypothetical protein
MTSSFSYTPDDMDFRKLSYKAMDALYPRYRAPNDSPFKLDGLGKPAEIEIATGDRDT